MLLYSFRNFFMLEFLLFLNFFENDIFKLSLVIKLPLFTKLNKLVLLLSYGMFAHWALQRMISSISISKPSFHIMLVIGLPPLQEARITEKMTFLLFTGTPLGYGGRSLLVLKQIEQVGILLFQKSSSIPESVELISPEELEF